MPQRLTNITEIIRINTSTRTPVVNSEISTGREDCVRHTPPSEKSELRRCLQQRLTPGV